MKFMKRYALFSLVFFCLSGISAFADTLGGVSGGGGETSPSLPATQEQIMDALQESRLALHLFFNSKQQEMFVTDSLNEKLFRQKRTIFDLIASTDIEADAKKECLDPHSDKKDGAAPGSHENSICISLSNLTKKLTQDNYWPQTIALVGHELSHLLGTDEDEATQLQKEILKVFQKIKRSHPAYFRQFGILGLHQIFFELRLANPLYLIGNEMIHKHKYALTAAVENLAEAGVLYGEDLSILGEQELEMWKGFLDQVRAMVREKEVKAYSDVAKLAILQLEKIIAQVNHLPVIWAPLIKGEDRMPSANPLRWQTLGVQMQAEDFQIFSSQGRFISGSSAVQITSDSIHESYTSLEATWFENGKQMRVNMYFTSDGKDWWVSEIRHFDFSNKVNDWAYAYGEFFRSPLGKAFKGSVEIPLETRAGIKSKIVVKNLKLKPLLLKQK